MERPFTSTEQHPVASRAMTDLPGTSTVTKLGCSHWALSLSDVLSTSQRTWPRSNLNLPPQRDSVHLVHQIPPVGRFTAVLTNQQPSGD